LGGRNTAVAAWEPDFGASKIVVFGDAALLFRIESERSKLPAPFGGRPFRSDLASRYAMRQQDLPESFGRRLTALPSYAPATRNLISYNNNA
jgi:hypothetical protein